MPFFQGAVKESTMVPRQTEESISKPLNILRYRQDLTNDEENLTLQLVKAPTPFLTDDDSVLISSPTRQDEGILKERKKMDRQALSRRNRLRKFLKSRASKSVESRSVESLRSAFVNNRINRRRRRERNRKRSVIESSNEKEEESDIELNIQAPLPSISPEDLKQWSCATDVNTLRLMFGTNKNKLWGDLDNETARRLYHTLLPRELIRLYRQGLQPDELAPLAFEARKAAKEYARERCHVPGRILAIAYDGFRHLKTYGSWSSNGMTWEEIWLKYEQQVKDEISEIWEETHGTSSPTALATADLSTKVCLKILERSCITNDQIDRLVLNIEREDENVGLLNMEKQQDLNTEKEVLKIYNNFEREIWDLTKAGPMPLSKDATMTAATFFSLKLLVFTKRKLLLFENWLSENNDIVGISFPSKITTDNLISPKKKIWDCKDTSVTKQ